MEERIKSTIYTTIIIISVVVFFAATVVSALVLDQTNKVLDRIEQLEAQIDKLERTNKQ